MLHSESPVINHSGSWPRIGRLVAVAVAWMSILVVASPVPAREAAIETSAPLADHSDEAIRSALTDAVVNAVKGAVAMGLTWVRLRNAAVLDDAVTVLIVASDTEQDAESADSDSEPTAPVRIDL
jgi:hypothetical protein